MDSITRRTAGKVLAFFGFGSSVAVADVYAQTVREDHDCSKRDACLSRLGLVGTGEITHHLNPEIPCGKGATAFGTGAMELELVPENPPCDELRGMIPPGSKLNAALHTLRRIDDLAFICGTFEIRDSQEVLHFEGDINLLHRDVNTHFKQFGNDPCDRRDHLQGWLLGIKPGNVGNRTLLRAMLVVHTDPRDGGTSPTTKLPIL